MKNIVFRNALMAVALVLSPMIASAATVDYDVDAITHSYNSGTGTGLSTGITLAAGETFSVDVDPTDDWVLSPSIAPVNADGNYTTQSGAFGTYTSAGLTANFGTLVGQIGSGDYFVIGTDFDGMANAAGELSLFMWDTRTDDNSGFITASVSTVMAAVPLPAGGAMLLLGLAGLGVARRRKA